jgi:hypothetical protein
VPGHRKRIATPPGGLQRLSAAANAAFVARIAAAENANTILAHLAEQTPFSTSASYPMLPRMPDLPLRVVDAEAGE